MRKAGLLSILLGVMAIFFYMPVYANPDAVVYKSALVWRADNKGDYQIPSLGPGTYDAKEVIRTDAIVRKISAVWKFSGEVKLELSLDAGQNYFPVVCGVPASQGFVPGDRITWRAKIGANSSLEEVKISYLDDSGAIASFGSPALSGFSFRKLIFINGSAKELFNHQVMIKVAQSKAAQNFDVDCSGRVRGDFYDVRFTAQDGETVLDHYREAISGQAPNRVAAFWVRVPQIPAQGLALYIYYGNDKAQDLSDGNKVFDFFDDFTAAAGRNKWETNGAVKYSAGDPRLQLESGEIFSKDYKFHDGVIEYQAQTVKGAEAQLIWRPEKNKSAGEQIAYSSGYKGAEHCLAVDGIVKVNDGQGIQAGGKYSYRIAVQANRFIFQRYTPDFSVKQAQVSAIYAKDQPQGFIGFKAGADTAAKYEWVRVRKLAMPEPVVAAVPVEGEEKAKNPEFFFTTLGANGDIILSEGEKQGWYVSAVRVAEFDVRIMVPQMSKIKIDLSADAGKTYTQACQAGKYYYASRRDFNKGTQVQWRAYLTKDNPYLDSVKVDYRPGAVVLISPNGREHLKSGQDFDITWTASEYESSYPFMLEYSLDKGKKYELISQDAGNSGMYPWKVPEQASSLALVRISDKYARDNVYDVSDDMFSIDR